MTLLPFNIVEAPPQLSIDDDNEQTARKLDFNKEVSFTGTFKLANEDWNNFLDDLFATTPIQRKPYRRRMIERAKKLQTNFIQTLTFEKVGDDFICKQGRHKFKLEWEEGDDNGDQGGLF